MDSFLDYDGYYVALIIVTIVTIAISLALSFYFIFIPSIRIADEFDNLEARGLQAFQNVTNLINTTTNLSDDVIRQTCDSIIYISNTLIGSPRVPFLQGCVVDLFCVNKNPLIPGICQQFITDIPPECQ